MKIKDEKFYQNIKNFLVIYLPKQRQYSINTQKSYKQTLNLLLTYIKDELKIPYAKIAFIDINRDNVESFLLWLTQTRKCSTATANNRLMAIKSFVKYCSIIDPSNYINQIEIGNIAMKKAKPKVVEFLSENAFKCLIEQPNTLKRNGFRDKVFLLLMYDIAARCQEMLDIKLSDISIKNKESIIYIHGKGGKCRRLPISDNIAQLINIYIDKYHPQDIRNENDYLFYTIINSKRNQMSPDAVALFISKYGSSARLICNEVPDHVHPHQIRHSRAMHLYRGGLNLILLSEFLGHANPATTKVYAWADTEMKRNALAQINNNPDEEIDIPIWKNDDTMILKLYGLL